MKTIFAHSFKRARFLILGWGLVLGGLGLFIVLFYDTFAEQQALQDQLMQAIPPDLMAFFGNVDSFTSPEGYLSMQFFSYIPVILGILAAGQGAGVIAADEAKGFLDLYLAHPISRRSYFWGRFISMVVILGATMLVIWLGFVLSLLWSGIPLTALEILKPFVVLWGLLSAFAAFATFISQILLSQAIASMVSASVLIASYIVTSLSNVIDSLKTAGDYSPMTYYQGADALNGINWNWLGWFIAATILFGILAWWRFERRDTRIGGEGGWTGIPLINLFKNRKSRIISKKTQSVGNK